MSTPFFTVQIFLYSSNLDSQVFVEKSSPNTNPEDRTTSTITALSETLSSSFKNSNMVEPIRCLDREYRGLC